VLGGGARRRSGSPPFGALRRWIVGYLILATYNAVVARSTRSTGVGERRRRAQAAPRSRRSVAAVRDVMTFERDR
jgi:hypothetical protein